MPKLTAIVHAHEDDADSLRKLLQTLEPCDEVLVVNHDGEDIDRVVKERGATLKQAVPGVASGAYVVDARHDWIFALAPSESLNDQLQTSLLEWKKEDHDPQSSFSVRVREPAGSETANCLATRLVNRTSVNWITELPANETNSQPLDGELLRLSPA